MIRILFTIFAFCFIASCSGNVKNTWSCKAPDGGKGSCISIKEADVVAFAQEEPKNNFSYINSNQKIEITLIAPKLKDLKKLEEEKGAPVIQEYSSSPKLRTQEKVGKVWFAPYIDGEGNQHSEYTVFVIDEESKWLIQK